jgi:hypothetical protein
MLLVPEATTRGLLVPLTRALRNSQRSPVEIKQAMQRLLLPMLLQLLLLTLVSYRSSSMSAAEMPICAGRWLRFTTHLLPSILPATSICAKVNGVLDIYYCKAPIIGAYERLNLSLSLCVFRAAGSCRATTTYTPITIDYWIATNEIIIPPLFSLSISSNSLHTWQKDYYDLVRST